MKQLKRLANGKNIEINSIKYRTIKSSLSFYILLCRFQPTSWAREFQFAALPRHFIPCGGYWLDDDHHHAMDTTSSRRRIRCCFDFNPFVVALSDGWFVCSSITALIVIPLKALIIRVAISCVLFANFITRFAWRFSVSFEEGHQHVHRLRCH